MDDRIYIRSYVPNHELIKWIASADASLVLIRNTCLSYYYAAPNKLYEALMAGLPVVASDFPEIRLVMDQAQAGLLVNPLNVKEVADAIAAIFESPARYRHLARNARRAAEREFNWEYERTKYLRILRRYANASERQRSLP